MTIHSWLDRFRKEATLGLGRLYIADARDLNYLMDRVMPEVAPEGSRLWETPHIYNQANTPACTGFSASGALTAMMWADRTHPTVVFNAGKLYKWANAHDGERKRHEGSSVRAAFKGLVTIGDQVVYSRSDSNPVGQFDKCSNYLWANTNAHDADIDRIITWILTVSPVVIGITWYESMFSPDAKGYIHPGGKVAGGHAIMVRGVNAEDPDNTDFVLRNSWGPWGIGVRHDYGAWTTHLDVKGGDVFLTKADLVALLKDNGEAGALVDPLD